jgi:WD40 repeat protein
MAQNIMRQIVLSFLLLHLICYAAAQPILMFPAGHTGMISSLNYSSDGKNIVTTAFGDNTVKIWEISSGKLVRSIEGYPGIRSAQFSPDGKYIVAVGQYSRSQGAVWEASSGKQVKAFNGNCAEFSFDAKRMVTTADDTVKVWDVASDKLIHSLKCFSDVTSVCFSPDGNHICTIGVFDNVVKIWEASTGRLIHSLEGYRKTAYVTSALFSPDGKYVLSIAELDRTAKIWETSTGKLIHLLIGHPGSLSSARYSADGRFIVTTSKEDKSARIWEAS